MPAGEYGLRSPKVEIPPNFQETSGAACRDATELPPLPLQLVLNFREHHFEMNVFSAHANLIWARQEGIQSNESQDHYGDCGDPDARFRFGDPFMQAWLLCGWLSDEIRGNQGLAESDYAP